MSGNETGTLAVADGILHWDAAGQGAPIILLHGFSFDRSMWEPQMAALSRHYRVIQYDLRGFGDSSLPQGGYSHVRDLAAVIAHFSPDERPLLAGLSLGANIIMEYVQSHSGRARAMALASPGLPGYPWIGQRPTEIVAQHARTHGIAAARRHWLDHAIYASLREKPGYARLEAMVERYHGWHWGHSDPRDAANDLTTGLPLIVTPTLILSGGTDCADYRAIADRLESEIPGAMLHRIEHVGHALNLEEPDAVTDALLAFAARH